MSDNAFVKVQDKDMAAARVLVYRLRLTAAGLVVIGVMLALGVSTALANMSGLSVTGVVPNPVTAGATFDFTFSVQFEDIDSEWLYRFEATLPAGWTINAVHNTSPTNPGQGTTQGSSGQLVFWETVDLDGMNWAAWRSGYSYTFSANVTAATCAGAPWNIPWQAIGDGPWSGFGAPPHSASGTVTVSCNREPVTVTLASGANPSMIGDSVPFNFAVVSGSGTPTGDVTVTASTGESCVGALTGGAGSCAITFATNGARIVSAAYPGDSSFVAGTSADVNQIVNTGGLSVGPSPLNLIEGGSGTYTISFSTVPSGSVTFQVAFDPAQVTVNGVAVSPASLTFAPAAFVTLTVAAVDNAVADGNRSTTISHAITAGPPEYPPGMSVSDVAVNIQDNDTPGVAVSPTTLQIAQAGGSAAYDIHLLTMPSASPVTIQVMFDNTLVTVNGQVAPFTLDLTDTTPVPLVVVALQDDVTTTILHAISASAAGEYPVGMALPAVQVTVPAADETVYPPPPPVPLVNDWNFVDDVPVRTAAAHNMHDLVHVRLIVEDYHYVTWLGADLYHGGHIGSLDVIHRTIIQAVDVYTIEWMPTFNGDVAICLLGMGEMWFLDANQAPRVPRQLTGWMTPAYPGYTCATLYWPGTLALVEGAAPTIMAPR